MLEGPFFNAHCHLELSHLQGAIPPGKPFVEWLGNIVRLKRLADPADSEAAARDAIRRLRQTGTTVIADILSMDTTDVPLQEELQRDAAFKAILFREAIQFKPEAGPATARRTLKRQHGFLDSDEQPFRPANPNRREALSPHAPYTITPSLLAILRSHSLLTGQWMCIHAAETAEETEMMVHGTGPLRDFLANVLPTDWKPPGMRPIAWLHSLKCLGPRTLLVHCNDVNDEDLAILKDRWCSVVVCPGTHVYFNRGEFPLRKLLDAGIPTYLGTDSLASNEDLDMRREIQLAVELSGLSIDVVAPLAAADRAGTFFAS